MKYQNIREEELKNKVAQDYFDVYDCTKIIGNVDFCVTLPTKDKIQGSLFETESLLWAEAKTGKSDIYKSIVQLILTIGKARTFDKKLPPAYLGAFDAEKIAFVSYNEIHDIFYANDFNWNVMPSNYETKEFGLVLEKITQIIDNNSLLFHFVNDDKEIKTFIKTNFIVGRSSTSKIKIDKNNFVVIYSKWLSVVKPTIAVNWVIAKKNGIIDGDFYLADLLSSKNESLKESLYVVLKLTKYELNRHKDEYGAYTTSSVDFNDKQKAHTQFWNKYDRPPKEDYWDYIIERRDLLVPQDVRERKGSFFTPQIWVELSQKYLTDVLGEDWQDEYYIWDCTAGTGNLLTGLTNKYNIWASTLDKQDVDVMHERIDTMNKNSVSGNGANLLRDHVFQFDFLNDEFTRLPKPLQEIINNPEKRKKLVIYINPPYAEAGSTVKHDAKIAVSNDTMVHKKYSSLVGTFAKRELFLQFFIRIYREIDGCILAEFSKLKILQSPYFSDFRQVFQAKLKKMFIVPANTFDNVKGKFPIGFIIWDTDTKEIFTDFSADVINEKGNFNGKKNLFSYENVKYLNDWLRPTWIETKNQLGFLACNSNDFQHQNEVVVQTNKNNETSTFYKPITKENLIKSCIYFAVRKVIEATWLNDRDQFLYPNNGWQNDAEFQNDCLAYTLFNNNIQSKYGTNQWIPFSEQDINSREKFESNFMTKYIQGKLKQETVSDLFGAHEQRTTTLEFSSEAQEVFNAGRELWKYYHQQPNCNVNASLYDIREYFQGRNDKGKMNNKSEDEIYMSLINELRAKLRNIEKKIEPKVYEYGFLKQ